MNDNHNDAIFLSLFSARKRQRQVPREKEFADDSKILRRRVI